MGKKQHWKAIVGKICRLVEEQSYQSWNGVKPVRCKIITVVKYKVPGVTYVKKNYNNNITCYELVLLTCLTQLTYEFEVV